MIERVILMCAGRAERWGLHRGVHKHLISINGEMILDRTLRLVRRHTAAKIVIVAFNPTYARAGHELYAPAHGPTDFCDTDKFLSSEPRWAPTGQTVMLYGDVFFTEAAMNAIFNHAGEHRFFGRREGSHFTGCPWRELFALSFPADERQLLRDQMLRVRDRLLSGETSKGGGWELHDLMHGTTGRNFTTIDDFTDDFDFPHDYDRWIKRYRNPLHRALVPLWSPLAKTWKWRFGRWTAALRKKNPPAVSPKHLEKASA